MTDSTRHEDATPAQRGPDPTASDAGGGPAGTSGTGSEANPAATSAGTSGLGPAGTSGLGPAGTSGLGSPGTAGPGPVEASAGGGPGAGDGPGDELPPGHRRSGLKNPAGAVRGMGAAALGLQGVILLLAIQPIRVLGEGSHTGAAWAAVVLAVVCFVLCGMMRRSWVWSAGTVVQAALLLGGFLHWALFALGVIFGLVWVYVLYVRRSILG
ncbi:DUF4233 domain-containing protein [Asanoa siamensis]|uniref:DUF4233 domain-containing protein n=1 Tax=Asanoa siamensis TaxID=926357 RepID=A0ABQ4D513_9ACTN|nr:DUF4233 domain-containing protein [Asanoa siamensis]GIF78338.1 hypothetical protein Asi02nite_78560 [Asanoa siamensis]